MAVVRDVLEAIHERRTSSQPDSDLFATFSPYALTPAEQAALVTPVNYAYEPYFLLRYISSAAAAAILSGATNSPDVTTGFQNCIDAACAVQGRPAQVRLPSGWINVTHINCSNSRVGGTIFRDGLIIQGAGQFATVVNGSPGKTKAVFDISGSQGLQMRDMLVTGVSGSVGVGIYSGAVNATTQSHQQHFRKVYVTLPTDSTANNNNGTVAFWNFGSEENTHTACYYEADIAAVFTASNTAPFQYLSPDQTMLSSHSCGVNQVNASLIGLSVTAVLLTVDVGSLHFRGYMRGVSSGYAHYVQGAFIGSIECILEDASTLLFLNGSASIEHSKYDVNFATPNSGAVIRLGDASAINNSEFRIYLNQLQTKQLFAPDVATNSTASTTAMRGTDFYTNLDKAYLLNGDIQFTGTKMAYVLRNCTDVRIHGPAYEYGVYEDRHTLAIPRKTASLVGAATPGTISLVKVASPAAGIATQLGVAPILEVNGAISASAANSNSWGARIQCFLPFYGDFSTNALTLGTGSGSVLSKSVQTAANFDVSSVTLTGAISSNEVTATLSVARTGTADTGIEFRGNATLWTDHTSVAVAALALV